MPATAAMSTIMSRVLRPLLLLRATPGSLRVSPSSAAALGCCRGRRVPVGSSCGRLGSRVSACSTEGAHQSALRSDDTSAATGEPACRIAPFVPLTASFPWQPLDVSGESCMPGSIRATCRGGRVVDTSGTLPAMRSRFAVGLVVFLCSLRRPLPPF